MLMIRRELPVKLEKKTWVDRLTDKSNLWLNAVRLEDEEDFTNAAVFYLQDAKEFLQRGLLARAALSCSCAAKCIQNINHEKARNFYSKAGEIYESNADFSNGKSIREILWSLKEAYINYLMANEDSRAKEAHTKFLSLQKKINPFFHEDGIQFNNPLIDFANTNGNGNKKSLKIDKALSITMQDFLNTHPNKNLHSNKKFSKHSGRKEK